jgi:hypothetical protein
MSEQQWHVVIQGKSQGPFPLLTVQSMIKEGKVSKDALVWMPTMAAWTCWREVPMGSCSSEASLESRLTVSRSQNALASQ